MALGVFMKSMTTLTCAQIDEVSGGILSHLAGTIIVGRWDGTCGGMTGSEWDAQINRHQIIGDALIVAGMNGEWVVGPEGYLVPGPEAEILLQAGGRELELADDF
jgi:hypothetical protein